MFRRRRDGDEGQPAPGQARAAGGRHARRVQEPGDLAAEDWPAEDWEDDGQPGQPGQQPAAGGEAAGGPWDADADVGYPEQQRVDLGSLHVPVHPDQQIQLELTDDQSQIVAVGVTSAHGRLQVRALAAPKSGGLWDEERGGIVDAIAGAGGQSWETEGPFGTEIHAQEQPEPGSGLTGPQPARFIGVDGPRWMLSAKISGPAAASPELAKPLEDVLAGIVVVRGDHPVPPRGLLEIQLPPEMRQAMAEQMAEAEAAQGAEYPNPFERGPEITETR
ncbi:MAG TPA: DUF3710 domain-containing protein [Streptosporangiaceae bacterium]